VLPDQFEVVSTREYSCLLFRAKTAPLGEGGGAVQLEEVSAGEAALSVEVIADGGVDGGKLL